MGSKNESEDVTQIFAVISAARQTDLYLHKSGHTRWCRDEQRVDFFGSTKVCFIFCVCFFNS